MGLEALLLHAVHAHVREAQSEARAEFGAQTSGPGAEQLCYDYYLTTIITTATATADGCY